MKKNTSSFNLVSRLAILLLVLLLAVGTTFSWYDRTKRGDGESYLLDYEVSGKINTGLTGVSVETYVGTKKNGIVKYNDVPLTVSGVGESVTTNSGEVTYFKTVIQDTANSGDSLISLYLSQFSCASKMGSKIHIGVVGPEKTYNEYQGTISGSDYVIQPMLIEDNILLKNNSIVEVYWFMSVDESYSGDGTVSLGVPYVVNN